MTFWRRAARWLGEALRSRWHIGLTTGLSFALALLVGMVVGHPDWGAVAAIGAFAGVYQAGEPGWGRVRLVAAIGAALCVVVPLSSLCAASPWLSAFLIGTVATSSAFVCRALRVPSPGEYFIVLTTLVATGLPTGDVPRTLVLVATGAAIAVAVTIAVMFVQRPGPGVVVPEPIRPDDVRARLREGLRADSGVLPVAARLGVGVTAGVLVGRVLGLEHSYWVGLTVAAVLQATDVHGLLRRAWYRVLGTVAGIGLAAAVFAPRPGDLTLVVIVMLALFAAQVLIKASYGIGVALTTLVPVVLYELAVPGGALGGAFGARVLDTVIGATLAVLICFVPWPGSAPPIRPNGR